MADKAYSSRANRAWLRRHGIQAVIPVKEDQKKHRRDRGQAGGRPPAFDASWYAKRNTVERCFAKLKQFRAVATRYDCEDEGVPPRVVVWPALRLALGALRLICRSRSGAVLAAAGPGGACPDRGLAGNRAPSQS